MIRLLIIEPDKVLSGILFNTFSNLGLTVSIMNNAQDALMAADKSKPDLVILEIQLVEHSGIEFLYEFRSYEEWKDIPIIIYTCVPPSEFSDNWQILKNDIGISQYLYKSSVNLPHLIDVVKELTPEKSEAI